MGSRFNWLMNLSGWIGMILVHAASLPTTVKALFGYATEFPSVEWVIMLWSGLFFFLLHSINTKNTVYIVSNGIGLTNLTILSILMFINSSIG
ncbi:hypothetical protein [Synechococcus phage BUCT-ZZ01]|nr:hypothetical protein [Synechococcus phage BUCT-ZZ01]